MSVPKADRLDIIIIGATGFTGKHAVKNMVKLIKTTDNCTVCYGISGRSHEKIRNLLSYLKEQGEDVANIPVIECDIKKDDISLVTKNCKVLVNCTGPNTVLSEAMVKACIATKTHYVDISAEKYHLISLYRSFHKAAEEANVLVVPACGFAAIPAVTGLIYLEKHFNGTLNSVDCYTDIIMPRRAYCPGPNKCLVHYGTWASMVHEFQNFRTYRHLKADTFPQHICGPETPHIERSFFHRHNGRCWFPYPGPDEDVVEISQRYSYEKKGKKPYHYNMYTTTPYFFHILLIVPIFFIYYYLSYFKCFRNLLWSYPRLFTAGYMSHKGPSEQMAKDTKFVMTFTGKGFEDCKEKTLQVKVSGSDPGYETTSMALILSALTILLEPSKVPKGGVLGVGAAFQDTQIMENIKRNNVLTFEMVTNENKNS